MISVKELDKSAGKLTDFEVNKLKSIKTSIEQLMEDKNYSEDNLRKVMNLWNEVNVFLEFFVNRVLYLSKRELIS